MIFREQTLDNGLQVIAECNDQAYSTGLGFFVRTGARDESDQLAGVSHFLEHMAFKGTATRTAADVNRQLDELGANSNAYTSEEKTVYYATVLPEYQSSMLELLADILRPVLRAEDFETEKKVIVEEILKYEDQPPFGAHEKCMAEFFGSHPLGKNVLGTVESVSGLTPEAMRAYFQQRYSPGNIVLAAAGNVDFTRLVEDAKRYCGHWAPYEAGRQITAADGRLVHRFLAKSESVQYYLVQIAAAPATEDPDRYASRVLATCIGDDSGSRFFWELVDRGLVEYAGLATYEFQGAGIYMGYLCCAPEDARFNLVIVDKVYGEIEREGVTADELELAQNKIASHIVLQSERPINRLFAVGSSWLQRREYKTVRQVLEAYQGVTRASIGQVLERFPLSRYASFAVGPAEGARLEA